MNDPARAGGAEQAASADRPRVVALGGGGGLSQALRAIRRYAATVTAVVSVADDGGSSGRLRRDLGVPAPGDLRKCLVALADGQEPWAAAFEHRFGAGELRDHALGNLVLVGLAQTLGDLGAALDTAGRLLGSVGRVLPATVEPVVLAATVGDDLVEGQVAIESATVPVRDLHVVPADPLVPEDALAAIRAADQILLGPGSLYTSVIAAACVPAIRAALAAAPGRVVLIANLCTEHETAGMSGTDHLRAVLEHGIRVDVFLYDPSRGLPVEEVTVAGWGVAPCAARVAAGDGVVHEPAQLAHALSALL